MGNLALVKPQAISTVQKGLVITKNFIVKQSPIILAATAVGGVVTTGVLAAKAGIRANSLIEEAKTVKGDKLTLKETVKVAWRPCVPAVISGALTIGAIVTSTAISQKRQAALAGLYALSETALKEYQDKIEKEYGKKDSQKILDDINGDRVKNAGVPPWDDSVLPSGDVLCYDKMSGRYFISSTQKIGMAVAEVNDAIYSGDMCVSLNEFYGILDNDKIKPCGFGDEVGWNIDSNCKPYYTSCLTSDMRPCIVLDWANGHEPSPRYRDI